ncbi:uncharacterized protein EURHEDRAFT_452570 [Aspergillus ruber CBS 135680]|uniref:Uncharacterized protein n=1 Tax=Aspergillus ruber (strain CBS 135680) TaxID=1388766 RepID=A0A017SJA1_ASPRC|nr:uncharacterized protein EURHEDRAFT_452570 [Aspergillus ruber CBS 135680]EYE96841.1 hypothetical protein EURHEDRAFT_452570 [Aspergillus ruber CBS 135680]
MSGKVPLAAFCEEYDEDNHLVLPETRQSQNRQQKQQKAHRYRPSHPLDGASDSGYSSRTVTSSQSFPSGANAFTEPPSLPTINTTNNPPAPPPPPPTTTTTTTTKKKKSTKGRDKMQVNPSYPPPGPYHGSSSHNRSSSTSRPKENNNTHFRHYPGTCWECENGIYHSAGPSGPSTPLEYPYYMSQPPALPDFQQHQTPPPPPPPMPAAQHPSSYAALPPPPVAPDVHVSSSRPSARPNRSNSYHANGRPLSFHGMMPGVGNGGSGSNGASNYYNMNRFEHGPPLSASAYTNSPSFGPANYGPQPPYYSLADYGPPPAEHGRERSMSTTREYPRDRRSSVYGPPMVDYDPPTPTYDDGEPLDRIASRDTRAPMSPQSPVYEPDEDFYRMPPPPIKKTSPQIIQKRPDPPRKSVTTTAVPHGRRGSTFDMTDMDAALPGDYTPPRTPRYRRSRENLIPERSRSLRSTRNYRDSSARPSRMAIEGARRRREVVYDYDSEFDDIEADEATSDLVDKQREAEEYQASKSKGHKAVPVPLTEDALYKTKASRAESDSGSQKSRSNSSRASDARTHSGSNAGTNNVNTIKEDEDKNLVMTMNGVTMSFTQESMNSKKINLRTNNTGALELSVEGKRPKKYLTSGGSDYTGAVARREIEPPAPAPRQIRDRPDRPRSERHHSRRSSRSTYGSGRFLA